MWYVTWDWLCWTASPLKARLRVCLPQEVVQNLLTNITRWPSEALDARPSSLNFSCGLGDTWKVFEQIEEFQIEAVPSD